MNSRSAFITCMPAPCQLAGSSDCCWVYTVGLYDVLILTALIMVIAAIVVLVLVACDQRIAAIQR